MFNVFELNSSSVTRPAEVEGVITKRARGH